VSLLLASSISEILTGQLHLVKGGTVQEGVRYCPAEKEVLESMEKLEDAQRFCPASYV